MSTLNNMNEKKLDMDLTTMRRFNRSLEHAIENLNRDAFAFCYKDSTIYQSFIRELKGMQRELINEIHKKV